MSDNDIQRSPRVSRRRFIAGALAGSTLSLAGCTSGGGPGNPTDADTLTIGFAQSYTGNLAQLGKDTTNGVKLRLEHQLGGEIDGLNIEFKRRDDAGDPNKGATIAQEYLQSDVDIVIGPSSSSVAASMLSTFQTDPGNLIWLTNTANINVVRGSCFKYHFRTSGNANTVAAPLAPYSIDKFGNKAFTIYSDYGYGQQTSSQFEQRFKEEGGEIVGSVAVPLGTSDFSTTVQKMKGSEADVVYCGVPGTDGVDFVKDFADYGLKKEMALTGQGATFTGNLLTAEGQAAVGAHSLYYYPTSLDTDRNNEFKQNVRDVYDTEVNAEYATGYRHASAIENAIKQAGSTDPDALAQALAQIEMPDLPGGYFAYSKASHEPIMDYFVEKVVEGDQAPKTTVAESLGRVRSPDWGCNIESQ